MDVHRKRIVITGAASGIGKALLHELSRRQVQIVAADKDDVRLRQAVQTCGESKATVAVFVCDLALSSHVDDLFDFALERMGGIDIFFANAGFAYCERIQQPDWDHIEAIFQTNVFSPIYAVEKMQALCHGSDYRVVITSSILGRVGLEGYALYASTKAALDRFAEAYRLESGKVGQLVLVYPLAVQSNFFQAAGHAPVPWLSQSPESAAQAMLRGVEKDRETIYTSWVLRPMLVVQHLFPFTRRWYQAIDARVFRRHWVAQGKEISQGESGHA
jgi:short-subunit dehydrogenase